MNKIVTSAGLLALGAATVYGYDPELTRQRTGRPWSVSAIVRGFYDDNPTTSPDRSRRFDPVLGRSLVTHPREDSFGIEVNPSVQLNLPLEQTFLRAGYSYSLRYFEDREPHDTDQSHEFNALLRHQFGPRHDITVADSLVISKEPSVVDQDIGIITVPTRTEADVWRNRGTIDYNVMLTQVLGLGLGYVNNWYDYDQSGPGSRSALLDRIEQYLRADLRWQIDPSLVGLIGYQFGMTDYTADEPVYVTPIFSRNPKLVNPKSDIRDSYSHYVYVGADHDFSGRLRGSIRLGGRYTDYHELNEDEISPYADASLTYTYMPGSSVQVGVRHDRNATDIASPSGSGKPTLDQESTGVYARLVHQITPDLTGSVLGHVQQSTWNGGGVDDEEETFYLVGLNLEYRINRCWSVETGYNFDLLESDLHSRGYDRNRVYVGVRATY